MKKTVDLQVAGKETMRVEAYLSETEGLAIHRQVVYVPGKEEHKFSSKWQVTHIDSGTALLRPSECFGSMAEAEALATSLSAFDWTVDLDQLINYEGVGAALSEALKVAVHSVPEESKTTVRRYIVKRNHEGPGYVVHDTVTESVVETHMHRGLASDDARSRNERASL